MKRCIAVLTLTLSLCMAHSADAFPHFTTFDGLVVNDPVNDLGDSMSELLDRVDPNGLIAVAIIGFEHGPEAAFATLLDMGFTPWEADLVWEMILEDVSRVSDGQRAFIAIPQL